MRRIFKILGILGAVLAGVGIAGAALLTATVLSRKPPTPIRSTTHPSLSRQACIDCHAPIAEEWRQSYHYRSLTGPYWSDVRRLGYSKTFERARKACVNCHAPANVLDLANGPGSDSATDEELGVECTPNLLREPKGTIPAARSDEVELGVDCTSCHVSKRGILGSGGRPTTAHETIVDLRFGAASMTAESLCRTCHRATVEAWKRTTLAGAGVTCLDCHMPSETAASVAGGPERPRRSHRFIADKDEGMLARAVDLSLAITPDRKAVVRIRNRGAGHDFPSGGNWVLVDFRAFDGSGRITSQKREAFGKKEALLLDFWPFNVDGRIAFGKEKEIVFRLPEPHGSVEASIRYHDWMRVNRTIAVLRRQY